MDPKRLAPIPSPRRTSDSDVRTSPLEKEAVEDANQAASSRPFRERRRARSLAESRHEALDSVNRLLLRYEKTNERLRQEEEKYRTLYEEAPLGIFQMSPEGKPLSVNRTMARICGFHSPGQMLEEVETHRRQLLVNPGELDEWKTTVDSTGIACGLETEVFCRDGARKWVSLNLRAVHGESGEVVRYEAISEDITNRKLADERIHSLAYYDPLTGLPNRTLFGVQLQETLADARWKHMRAALVLLELGRFKIINDTHGQSFGDRLLQEIAERIKRGAGEDAIVSRLGGGEFALVLPQIESAADAMGITQRVVAALSTEFSVAGHSLSISFNVGISIFPENGQDGEALLQTADVAMYAAKEDGPNKCRMFTEAMNAQIKEQLTLENALRLALDRNEFYVEYQPQVNICSESITGFEALLRWRHPQLGLVPPNQFIPIAEHAGLIVPIGEWVLRIACGQAKRWQDAGLPAVPVAVNVSAVQFRQLGFSDLIRSVLEETGLDPRYLELELTESLLLTNADVMFSILQELREMGVKLAIDDFGTGYSSLSYLRQFQVNRLKIDRSFVRDVAVNSDDAAITTAIIRMAKALNLEVLAEGVEDEAQLSFLRAQHCYEIQGFYFSRPVAVDEAMQKLMRTSIQPASHALAI